MDSPIALLFKNARLRLGVTQTQMAERLARFGYKVGQTFITMVERGKATPDRKHAPAIAKALNVPEQAVLDAIIGTKFPDLKLVAEPLKRYGWFVEVTPLEHRRIVEFVEDRGFESPEALIRRILLQFLDEKAGKR